MLFDDLDDFLFSLAQVDQILGILHQKWVGEHFSQALTISTTTKGGK